MFHTRRIQFNLGRLSATRLLGIGVFLDAVAVFRLLDFGILLRLGHSVLAGCRTAAFLWLYPQQRRLEPRVTHPRSVAVGDILGQDRIMSDLVPVDLVW